MGDQATGDTAQTDERRTDSCMNGRLAGFELKPPSAERFSPAVQRSLAFKAYEELRDRILTCDLEPGRTILAQDLAHQLGMSRTPVNDALKMLRNDGLVMVIPRVGHVVTALTLTDVQEIFQLRLHMEPYAVELALRNATDTQLQEFRRTCFDWFTSKRGKQKASHFPVDDMKSFHISAEVHDAFHLQIAMLSGNRRLMDVIRGLLDASRRMQVVGIAQEFGGKTVLTAAPPPQHAALADAMVSRDQQTAVRLMADHIRAGQERVLVALKEGRLKPVPSGNGYSYS